VNSLIVDKVTFSNHICYSVNLKKMKKLKKCHLSCHLQKIKMTIGWQPHVIWFTFGKKCKSDEVSSSCHFQNKMITGWSSSGCHAARSKKLLVGHPQSQNTKLTTLINNTTY